MPSNHVAEFSVSRVCARRLISRRRSPLDGLRSVSTHTPRTGAKYSVRWNCRQPGTTPARIPRKSTVHRAQVTGLKHPKVPCSSVMPGRAQPSYRREPRRDRDSNPAMPAVPHAQRRGCVHCAGARCARTLPAEPTRITRSDAEHVQRANAEWISRTARSGSAGGRSMMHSYRLSRPASACRASTSGTGEPCRWEPVT